MCSQCANCLSLKRRLMGELHSLGEEEGFMGRRTREACPPPCSLSALRYLRLNDGDSWVRKFGSKGVREGSGP